jgi:histidinol phosphatase-like PHP family hydrolase
MKESGVKFIITSDAHRPREVASFQNGIDAAVRAG